MNDKDAQVSAAEAIRNLGKAFEKTAEAAGSMNIRFVHDEVAFRIVSRRMTYKQALLWKLNEARIWLSDRFRGVPEDEACENCMKKRATDFTEGGEGYCRECMFQQLDEHVERMAPELARLRQLLAAPPQAQHVGKIAEMIRDAASEIAEDSEGGKRLDSWMLATKILQSWPGPTGKYRWRQEERVTAMMHMPVWRLEDTAGNSMNCLAYAMAPNRWHVNVRDKQYYFETEHQAKTEGLALALIEPEVTSAS